VIYVPDVEATPRIDQEARAAGWEADADVLMVLRGGPAPLTEKAQAVRVEEVPYGDAELQRTQWEFRRLGGDDQEYGDDVFQQLLERDAMLATKGARWFTGSLEGELAGYCDVSAAPNGLMYVDNVVTGKPYRRRGVASAVVAKALEAVRRDGGTDAYLYADEGAPAVGIYERVGFRVMGRAPSFTKKLR
jgi:ribosomal protein S18 acetylase RimI-like enzyme